MFEAVKATGVSGRAFSAGRCTLDCWNPRDFSTDNHRTVDDRPYGGGPGMVMLVEPLERSIEAAKTRQRTAGFSPWVINLSPQGRPLTHRVVTQLALRSALVLLCGRYEAMDERVLQGQVDQEISIGDYVISGGELAAMVLMDAVLRLQPGVLRDEQSAQEDSFVDGLLDCPHYTRPESYQGRAVPQVLLSGNHADIARWRQKESLGRTLQRRPDLLAARVLTEMEYRLLDEFKCELALADGNRET